MFQDRGVDLSFDMNVKKENFEPEAEMRNVKSENCDLRVKSESLRSDTNQTNLQSPSSKELRGGGGRLKFYKGQYSNFMTNSNDDDDGVPLNSVVLVWKCSLRKRSLGDSGGGAACK